MYLYNKYNLHAYINNMLKFPIIIYDFSTEVILHTFPQKLVTLYTTI